MTRCRPIVSAAWAVGRGLGCGRGRGIERANQGLRHFEAVHRRGHDTARIARALATREQAWHALALQGGGVTRYTDSARGSRLHAMQERLVADEARETAVELAEGLPDGLGDGRGVQVMQARGLHAEAVARLREIRRVGRGHARHKIGDALHGAHEVAPPPATSLLLHSTLEQQACEGLVAVGLSTRLLCIRF